MKIRLKQLRVQAFRAYPGSRDFPFPDKVGGSILLYAPNGHGKSSLTDAFEFLLNPDATLERLGIRDAEMNSGRKPLRNTHSPASLKSLVELKLMDLSGSLRTGAREAKDGPSPIPAELTDFGGASLVDFIVRGPDLRKLVYDTTPKTRYDDLARYINAERLSILQSGIRSIESQLRREAESHDQAKPSLDRELKAITSNALTSWSLAPALAWLNMSTIVHGLTFATLEDSDPTFAQLEERAANERSTLGQQQFKDVIARIDSFLEKDASGNYLALLLLSELEVSKIAFEEASKSTAQASSRHVVTQAIELLKAVPEEYPTECPVCGTRFDLSPHGTREAVVAHLEEMRTQLATLTQAEIRFSSARRSWESRVGSLDTDIARITDLCGVHKTSIETAWASCRQKLLAGAIDRMGDVAKELALCRASAEASLASTAASTPTFVPLLDRARKLAGLKKRYERWALLRARREIVISDITKARGVIDAEAYAFVAKAVRSVEAEVISFYTAVQSMAPVPVGIKMSLMPTTNADSRGLELLIDFPHASDAKPRAYLSDSQINTLALGLRLALIRKFNPDLPFAVLDDVVTSYDADYRRQIAKVILQQFADMQLVVLTHDEQFFRELRDRINGDDPSRWRIRQIQKFAPDTGPIFADAPTSESEIDQKLNDGQSASNIIRTYLERWALRVGEGIGAQVTLRQPPDYACRELIESLVAGGKRFGLDERLSADADLRSLVSELQNNSILNLGSHGGENPHRTPSTGDEKSLWKDVKKLVEIFTCSCGKRRFKYDPASRRSSCEGCGAPLNLAPTPAPVPEVSPPQP